MISLFFNKSYINKQQSIQKQSYIKSTIDPAAYAPVNFNDPNN